MSAPAKVCSEGCEWPVYCRGLCKRCYYRDWRRRAGHNVSGSEAHRAILRDQWIDQFGEPRWTRDSIVRAILLWAKGHDGEPPAGPAWPRGTRRHPGASTVQRAFGSWNNALDAASPGAPTDEEAAGSNSSER
jgi:hypothetical protein